MQNSSVAQVFGFMLTEQFSMIAFTAALETAVDGPVTTYLDEAGYLKDQNGPSNSGPSSVSSIVSVLPG